MTPWGLAFLPDGRMLVTERPGRLRFVTREGKLSPPFAGVPEVWASGQGGLLDVALDRDFARNATLYLCYSERAGNGGRTAVARAKFDKAAQAPQSSTLDGGAPPRLSEVKVIFRQEGPLSSGNHYGCRIAQGADGNLFVSLGDHYGPRDEAQNLGNHIGKIVRITPDGAAPPDNPFVGRAGAKAGNLELRPPQSAVAGDPSRDRQARGRSSTARAAATRSTSSRRARTTAGR